MFFRYPPFDFFRKNLGNRYVKSVGLLMTGTTIAQLINILILPVLTRLYTPFEFDALTVFMSATVIVSLGASLGYDLAIPIAENNEDAKRLCWVAAICAFLISIVVALATIIVPQTVFSNIFHQSSDTMLGYFLPLSCLVTALSISLENFFVQTRQFRIISMVRICQATVGSGLQTGLFFLGWGGDGLIIGFLAMSAVPAVLLGSIILMRCGIKIPSLFDLKLTALQYSRFPKFTAVESFANAASVYLPLIIISTFAAGTQAAYLMLAIRVMQAPLLLIGRAVSQVAQSHTNEWKKTGNFGAQVTAILQNLVSLTIGGVTAVMISAPFLAGTMFGEKWSQVGTYFAMIIPAIYFQVLSYIMMPLVYTYGRNKTVMTTTIAGTLFRSICVLFFSFYYGALWGAIAYCFTGAIYYLATVRIYGNILDINFKSILKVKKYGIYLFFLLNGFSVFLIFIFSKLET